MKTLEEIKTWLKSSGHIRVILVKVEEVGVSGTPTAFYLSSKPFITSASDTPSSTAFDACLIGGVSFNGEILLDGSANIGFGDIEIDNTNGIKDSWLNYIWTNKKITIYIGDPSWSYNDFYSIFTGIVSDISIRSQQTLNLILVDKSQILNVAISEEILPKTDQVDNSEVLIPLVFGECFNVSPITTNAGLLEYQVHNGPIEDIIEVRDNGLPVEFTKDLANGKFTLNQSVYGQITCSVQGAKIQDTYYNNVPDIIKIIVKNYGPLTSRLTDADIDLTTFSQFGFSQDTATFPVGLYCTNRENILDICNQLAASIGARLIFNAKGLLQLVKYDLPAANETNYTTITEQDVEDGTVVVQEKIPVKATTKIAYCKNWTVQSSGLADGIVPEHTQLFSTEWLYTTNTNATTAAAYKLDTSPEQEDTLLINKAGADSEALRRNTLLSTPRFIYDLKCYPHLLFLNPGDFVKLYNSRYGLSSGKLGTVVRVDKDWISGRINVGVLI